MPFLFREIRFCPCGRPAMIRSAECRTCYEDAVRRQGREERRQEAAHNAAGPLTIIQPRLRSLFADKEHSVLSVESPARPRPQPTEDGHESRALHGRKKGPRMTRRRADQVSAEPT